jgi:hypothetical protein
MACVAEREALTDIADMWDRIPLPFLSQTMGRANRKQLENRWKEAGLETPDRDSSVAEIDQTSPEDRLLQAAAAVTIGKVQEITRWKIEKTTAPSTPTCHSTRCYGHMYYRDTVTRFTDATGEHEPVLAHSECEDDVLRELGGQKALKVAFPHEVTFGDSYSGIVDGKDGQNPPEGFSGNRFEQQPLGRDAWSAFIDPAMLEKLRAAKPDLSVLEQTDE